jgi:predicted enzyme related to lactoylglutathione lyase
MAMAHGDITHLEIPVTDFERARSFYTALFGWRIEAPPGYEEYPMWHAPNQISGGALTPRKDDFTQPRSVVEVDSVADALATAAEQGGTVLVERSPIGETMWWGLFADPDGNVMGVFEGTM